jgi:D-alanyl-D-alanine carboxypeptidase
MENINAFLKQQADHKETPSIQYVFFDSDSIVHEFRYGFANVKTRKLVDTSTTYHLFSITKTFTALAILQLAERGKLNLEDPVINYLPDFPYSNKITIEQLLSHTSGIPNPLPLRWIHLAEEHQSFNRDVFFKEIFRKNSGLKSEPGTQLRYSNLGYVLLGQLIEKISGQLFETYIKENIFEPIGAKPGSLGFEIDPSIHAVGYHKCWSISNIVLGLLIDKRKYMGEREGAWKPFHHFYNNGIAYGGMISSCTGLIKYAQALLKNDSMLINRNYKNILFTEKLVNQKGTGMSLSWFTGKLKGNSYFAHAGGGGGYYTELRLYPDLNTGSIIMYNRSGMTDQRMLNKADSFFISEKRL